MNKRLHCNRKTKLRPLASASKSLSRVFALAAESGRRMPGNDNLQHLAAYGKGQQLMARRTPESGSARFFMRKRRSTEIFDGTTVPKKTTCTTGHPAVEHKYAHLPKGLPKTTLRSVLPEAVLFYPIKHVSTNHPNPTGNHGVSKPEADGTNFKSNAFGAPEYNTRSNKRNKPVLTAPGCCQCGIVPGSLNF